jgi:hypothetical protein
MPVGLGIFFVGMTEYLMAMPLSFFSCLCFSVHDLSITQMMFNLQFYAAQHEQT